MTSPTEANKVAIVTYALKSGLHLEWNGWTNQRQSIRMAEGLIESSSSMILLHDSERILLLIAFTWMRVQVISW